jgi:hypothetical protein
LIEKFQALEVEINQREKNVKMLMQAVKKEAFERKTKILKI